MKKMDKKRVDRKIEEDKDKNSGQRRMKGDERLEERTQEDRGRRRIKQRGQRKMEDARKRR